VKDRREESAERSFIARPPDYTWWDYQIIMWQTNTAAQYVTLKKLGISVGAAFYRDNNARWPPDYLLENDLRWYVENIATDLLLPSSSVPRSPEELEVSGGAAALQQRSLRPRGRSTKQS